MLKFEHPTFKDVLSRPGRMGFIWPKTEETFCQSRLSLLTSATSSCNDINAVSNNDFLVWPKNWRARLMLLWSSEWKCLPNKSVSWKIMKKLIRVLDPNESVSWKTQSLPVWILTTFSFFTFKSSITNKGQTKKNGSRMINYCNIFMLLVLLEPNINLLFESEVKYGRYKRKHWRLRTYIQDVSNSIKWL